MANMQEPISVMMARSVMNRYKPENVLWHYEHGLVLQSIYAVGRKYNISEFCDYVKTMYDTKIQDDGEIATYKKDEFNLDQINPGKHLFDLYKDTNEEKYRKAIEVLREQLRNHPRTESGGFWHKKIYPWQMWLDGLYMQGPFYARYAKEFGTKEDFEDVVKQFELVYVHTKNEESGLLYHAWDESCKQLWADSETGRSPHFWGRAMGWYCMAILDVLDLIPDTDEYKDLRAKLIAISNELVKPVMNVQDKTSGLWYQVLDMPSRDKNYLESSCSSMFTRFLFKMVKDNLLDISVASKEDVLNAANAGYKGLLSKVSSDSDGNLHLAGICSVAGLGGNPYRDGSYEYYVKEAIVSDDFKGVGPFIFASLESEEINA